MKSFQVAMLGVVGALGASAPAAACPGKTACLARAAVVRAETAATYSTYLTPPASLDLSLHALALQPAAPAEPLLVFDPLPAAKPIAKDAEAFWNQARTNVYARMPKVERKTLTFTASPVIVTGTFDTVPGVGISGDF